MEKVKLDKETKDLAYKIITFKLLSVEKINEADLIKTREYIEYLLSSYSFEKYLELILNIVDDYHMADKVHVKFQDILCDYNENYDVDYIIKKHKIKKCVDDADMFILLHLISLQKHRRFDLIEVSFCALSHILILKVF